MTQDRPEAERKRVMFILSTQGGRIMASGTDTAAASMIELAGAVNAVTGFAGYKPITDEAVLAAAPDVLVMMAREGDHNSTEAELSRCLPYPSALRRPAGRWCGWTGFICWGSGRARQMRSPICTPRFTPTDPMTALADFAPPRDRRRAARKAHLWMAAVLAVAAIGSLAIGASGTSLWHALFKIVTGAPLTQLERVVLWDIRLPRLIMGICVGAALAVSGAVMQGLFATRSRIRACLG